MELGKLKKNSETPTEGKGWGSSGSLKILGVVALTSYAVLQGVGTVQASVAEVRKAPGFFEDQKFLAQKASVHEKLKPLCLSVCAASDKTGTPSQLSDGLVGL